jgi:hypothetical protein
MTKRNEVTADGMARLVRELLEDTVGTDDGGAKEEVAASSLPIARPRFPVPGVASATGGSEADTVGVVGRGVPAEAPAAVWVRSELTIDGDWHYVATAQVVGWHGREARLRAAGVDGLLRGRWLRVENHVEADFVVPSELRSSAPPHYQVDVGPRDRQGLRVLLLERAGNPAAQREEDLEAIEIESLDDLRAHLHDADPRVRREAAHALAGLGSAAAGAIENLQAMENDPDRSARLAALAAIDQIRRS